MSMITQTGEQSALISAVQHDEQFWVKHRESKRMLKGQNHVVDPARHTAWWTMCGPLCKQDELSVSKIH